MVKWDIYEGFGDEFDSWQGLGKNVISFIIIFKLRNMIIKKVELFFKGINVLLGEVTKMKIWDLMEDL